MKRHVFECDHCHVQVDDPQGDISNKPFTSAPPHPWLTVVSTSKRADEYHVHQHFCCKLHAAHKLSSDSGDE